MSNIVVLSIGRAPENAICMGEADNTISRKHAELVLAQSGAILAVDCNSTCGTFVHRTDGWQSITQEVVNRNDKIRLGEANTVMQVGDLLKMAGY